jgi:hypothetical protein
VLESPPASSAPEPGPSDRQPGSISRRPPARLSASAAEVGILRAALFLPFLLATLPLGVLVDRRRRLPLMIGADLGRFVLIGSIPVLVWVGAAQMEILYIIVFAAGSLTVLYQLADFAFLPRVVAADELLDAVSRPAWCL